MRKHRNYEIEREKPVVLTDFFIKWFKWRAEKFKLLHFGGINCAVWWQGGEGNWQFQKRNLRKWWFELVALIHNSTWLSIQVWKRKIFVLFHINILRFAKNAAYPPDLCGILSNHYPTPLARLFLFPISRNKDKCLVYLFLLKIF